MEENTWHQLMASPNVHACTRVHIHALHLYSYMLPHMQICTCIIHIRKHKPCARACMHAHRHTQIGKHRKVKQWPGVLSLPADKWPSLHQLCVLSSELRGLINNCCFWSLFCIFPLGEELLEVSKPRILSTPFSLLGICISQRHVNICFVWCGMLSQTSCTSLACAASHCPWAQSDCFSWLCPWTDDSSCSCCTDNEDASWFSLSLPQALPSTGGSMLCADAREILWWGQADLIWVH